ncbi:MAG: DUF2808 domain-containing protein [Xenococcaceae cyanobacterium]
MKITKMAINIATSLRLITLLSTGLIVGTLYIPVASSVQFPSGGRVAFDKSPLLRNAVTTLSGVRVWGAKYYFTVELPEDAGEPLQKVVIAQRQGADDIIFRLDKTTAYNGTHRRKEGVLTLQSVSQDEETKAITIIFAAPIPPGTTFTVGLRPRRNPDFGGVYLFGVTAFPSGENPYGLYLGAGRLQFYQGGDSFFDR